MLLAPLALSVLTMLPNCEASRALLMFALAVSVLMK